MGQRRDIRRVAMQLLYQMDLTATTDRHTLLADLADWDQAPTDRDRQRAAVELALAAWEDRAEADRHVAELAPDWPTHRQPPVDRAILRLAAHEMASGHAPASVAINEAVELAKRFAGEHSPAFINGVLDKLARRVEPPQNPQQPPAEADDWLRDATEGEA